MHRFLLINIRIGRLKIKIMDYDAYIDITTAVCPVTFVKVKVALARLDDKKTLYIKLNNGESVQNVPGSLKDEGHKVVKIDSLDDGTFGLYVVKNGLEG